MKAESLGFHMENLLPGTMILCSILILTPVPKEDAHRLVANLKESEFLVSVSFLTAAYLLGLISAMFPRFAVDWLSELAFRPVSGSLATPIIP